ncbi:hypothetical protein EGK59_16540 [Acinetobacter soli]|nr:hypothetical protein EGK59_16540 [Acinetobacter soli]
MSYALIADFLQDRQSFKFFIRHRHQHIKPSAKEIAEVHILKADIFTLEKPDISILELQRADSSRFLISKLLKLTYATDVHRVHVIY